MTLDEIPALLNSSRANFKKFSFKYIHGVLAVCLCGVFDGVSCECEVKGVRCEV